MMKASLRSGSLHWQSVTLRWLGGFVFLAVCCMSGAVAARAVAADSRPAATAISTRQGRPCPAAAGGLSCRVNAVQSRLPDLLTSLSGNDFAVRPPAIYVTNDGTAVLGGPDTNAQSPFGHITWSDWTQSSADGSGAIWLDDCVPDCGSGTRTPYPLTLHASAPRDAHFTRLTYRYEQEDQEITYTLLLRHKTPFWFYYFGPPVVVPAKATCDSLASIEHGWASREKELVPLPAVSSETVAVGLAAEISLGSVGICSNALTDLKPTLELVPPAFALTSDYSGSVGPTSTTFTYSFWPLGWDIPPGTGVADLHPPVTIDWDRPHEAELGPSASFTYKPHKPVGVSLQLFSVPIKKVTVTLLALTQPFLSASVGPELGFELSFDRKDLAEEKAMDEADGETPEEADQEIVAEIESDVETAVQDEASAIDPAAVDEPAVLTDATDVSSIVGRVADSTLAADAGAAMDAIVATVDGDAVAVGGADAATLDGAAEAVGSFDFLEVLPLVLLAADTAQAHGDSRSGHIPRHPRPLPRQPLKATAIRSLSPRSLQRPEFDHATVASLVRQFLALRLPAKVRPLAVSSTSLHPGKRVSVVATGLGHGPGRFASLVLAGPRYFATRLLRISRHAAGATITLPRSLAKGTWMIAIQSLSSVHLARKHRLRGFATVRIATFTVPAVPATVVRAVTFGGDPAEPQITVNGSAFGIQPAATNVAYQNYTGYDYGNDLYFCDTSSDPNAFCAGQNDGSGAWDTIGLVIGKYTDSQISYSLGSDYAQSYYPGNIFKLQQGDSFAVHVNGADCSGVVDFSGRPVPCG